MTGATDSIKHNFAFINRYSKNAFPVFIGFLFGLALNFITGYFFGSSGIFQGFIFIIPVGIGYLIGSHNQAKDNQKRKLNHE